MAEQPFCDFEPIAFPSLADFQFYADANLIDGSIPMELEFIETPIPSSSPMAPFHPAAIHQHDSENLNALQTAMWESNEQPIDLTALPSIKESFHVPVFPAATSIAPVGGSDRSSEISLVAKPRW